MSHRARICVLLLFCVALAAGVRSAQAEGLRNIASFTADTYFDGTWWIESSDAFLARVIPALTLQAKITRDDTDGWFQHVFYLGPVVSFTDTLYLDAGYGLGADSNGDFSHEVTATFNFETDSTAASAGMRVNMFPASGYWYVLPSVSGRFRPIPALGLFGKFFLSVDRDSEVTESFWGEADYLISRLLTARAGFTVSRASNFGWSLIAGMNFSFTPDLVLKYSFEYLADTVEYVDTPQQSNGVSNALILDVKF